VVVFDEYAVEKTETVVVGTAGANGVFFEYAQAGCRFARVHQADGTASHNVGIPADMGGDAGHALEQVEGGAFAVSRARILASTDRSSSPATTVSPSRHG
jgi:hypothetical protein